MVPLQWDVRTGWPNAIESELREVAECYGHDYGWLKVGITGNPEIRRWAYKEWDLMVVLYQSASLEHVKDMEDRLINYLWDEAPFPVATCNNERGGGSLPDSPPYYLYVVWQVLIARATNRQTLTYGELAKAIGSRDE
ncbi:MAG: hypothetical protein OXE02_08265 [Chloroflexi bacterium]|nr:hypothetical protein [Chloroflexota bacterium]